MDLKDFDYELPPGRIAANPADPRHDARLMVLDRASGATEDRRVRDLPDLLQPGDILVVNDTKVRPARLYGRRPTGGRVEVLLLRREPGGAFQALVRAHRAIRPGETLAMDGGIEATLLERDPSGAVWRVRLAAEGDVEEAVERAGHVPLPPYIKRPEAPEDRARYQTIFASRTGAAAAPTAGLHFTPDLVARLESRGVSIVPVTLHVGYGTFQPIESLDQPLHAEDFLVTEDAAERILGRRGRLVAVGTTVTRVLETLARTGGIRAAEGRTDLFLKPGEPFLAVEALLTNFHLPRSSLLVLVCAFAGRECVLDAYRRAVREKYRFYSYGDAMLIR